MKVPNSPKVYLPRCTFISFIPKVTSTLIAIKLPTADNIEIIIGDIPKSPAPTPFVRAFTERAIPRIIDIQRRLPEETVDKTSNTSRNCLY